MEEIDFLGGGIETQWQMQQRERINHVLHERGKGRTLVAIARDLGVTHERVRQIEAMGVRRLRKPSMQDQRERFIACYPERGKRYFPCS